MKTTLVLFLSLILGFNGAFARQEKLKDIRRLDFPKHLQTLNISASSETSYMDAMNRLARMTPNGYSISSLQYVRSKGKYIVIAKLTKAG